MGKCLLEIFYFKNKSKTLTACNDRFEKLRDIVAIHSKLEKYAAKIRNEAKIFLKLGNNCNKNPTNNSLLLHLVSREETKHAINEMRIVIKK